MWQNKKSLFIQEAYILKLFQFYEFKDSL